MIVFDEGWNIPDYAEDVELALRNCLVGQVDIVQLQAEQMVAHHPHLLVGLHVKDVDGVHVVEGFVEGFGDLNIKIYHSVEDPDFLELHELHEIRHLLLVGVHSFKFLNQHTVRVQPQVIFNLPLQRQHVVLLKASQQKGAILLEDLIVIL